MQAGLRKFATLDALRGVAAILVVMRHTESFFGFSLYNSYLAVDFFYILSGFVLAHNYERRLVDNLSPSEFLKIRFIRLYPLYLLSFILILITFALGIRFTSEVPDSVFNASLIYGLFMLPFFMGSMYIFPINTIAWSLFFELFGNYFYAFFAKFLTTRNLIISVIICAPIYFSGAFIALPDATLDIGWRGSNFFFGIFRFWLSFGLGLLIYRKFKADGMKEENNSTLFIRIALFLAIVLMHPKLPMGLTFVVNIIEILVIFPAIVYYGAQFEPEKKLTKFALFMGKISYPAYVLQISIALFIAYFSIKTKIYPDHYQPLFGIAYLAILLGASSWLNDYFDKPLRAKLTQWLLKKPKKIEAIA